MKKMKVKHMKRTKEMLLAMTRQDGLLSSSDNIAWLKNSEKLRDRVIFVDLAPD